jgi:uncharacterized PurR-regulated membrane protein YhhQ (DUF165 family)
VLASCFLVATLSLFVLGQSHFIDLDAVIARLAPDLELPVALQLPVGVLPTVVGFAAVMLVCELYGRPRAAWLVAIGLFGGAAITGVMFAADLVDGKDVTFGPVLSIASYYVAGHITSIAAFDALRHRTGGKHLWLRVIISSLIAQPFGWLVFGAIMYGYVDLVIPASVLGAALFTTMCLVVLAVPLALVARALSLFLRISRHEVGFEIVQDDDRAPQLTRAPILPFSKSELRFFTEGDRLGEPLVAD